MGFSWRGDGHAFLRFVPALRHVRSSFSVWWNLGKRVFIFLSGLYIGSFFYFLVIFCIFVGGLVFGFGGFCLIDCLFVVGT